MALFWGKKDIEVLPEDHKPAVALPSVKKRNRDAGILLLPRTTEKTAQQAGAGVYVYRVPAHANKIQIASAVAAAFDVGVARVNILNAPGKERRRGKQIGWKPGFRKAIVTLKKGQRIES